MTTIEGGKCSSTHLLFQKVKHYQLPQTRERTVNTKEIVFKISPIRVLARINGHSCLYKDHLLIGFARGTPFLFSSLLGPFLFFLPLLYFCIIFCVSVFLYLGIDNSLFNLIYLCGLKFALLHHIILIDRRHFLVVNLGG